MIQTISLAMIVRNEEVNLEECLNSIKDEVDEIVIVDTGSTDQTLMIASKFTKKIYQYTWQGDFSAARNFAINKCSGQWILSLDADEKLDLQNGNLRQLLANNLEAEVFSLPLLTNSGAEYDRFSVIRLFRNTTDYRFVGKIHEQVLIPKLNVVGVAHAPVIHHKFITHKQRNKKRNRNLKLLRQAINSEPDNYYLKYYYGVEWLGLGRYEQALPYFQEAVNNISLDKIMFRGSAVRYLVDCLKFLGRLDEAFKVCQRECELNPEYTDVFFEAGAILEEQGKYKQALDYFHKAILLGEPPVVYYHSQGTESFLAYYHLGYCYEKIGCRELAEKYYWQALSINDKYTYPLYSLFLLVYSNLQTSEVFNYFSKRMFFVQSQWAKLLAQLFFNVGLPDLAARCYVETDALSRDKNITRIKSLLYSGCIQEALELIHSLEQASIPVNIAIEEIMAYILKADYCSAKKRALALWKNSPDERSKAWALLTIIARMSSNTSYVRPEKSREQEIVQFYLIMVEDCLRYNDKNNSGTEFKHLARSVISILVNLSADSNISLLKFLNQRAEAIRLILDYKYSAARRLYL